MSPFAGIAAVRPWRWWRMEFAILAVLLADFAILLIWVGAR